MNIIHVNQKWLKSELLSAMSPMQKSMLLKNYALKDFRLVLKTGECVDLWLGDLDIGDYGSHAAIFIRTPLDADDEWEAIVCSDTELAQKLYHSGTVFTNKGGFHAEHRDEAAMPIVGLWFMINRTIMKKYKTVVKIGKRRHLIQELGATDSRKYQQKPIKIADGISYIWEYENPRAYDRHCEAWGVRGHYRHYKSGKVIYIRPHIRGSGRLKDSCYDL